MTSLPDLCDQYPEHIQVLDPLFRDFGARQQFSGEIVCVKCFEDNSLVKELVDQAGQGKVMVVDGGGSLRRALLGDMLAEKACTNGWEGFVIYGCVRDVEILKTLDVGIKALNAHPMKTEKRGEGQHGIAVNFAGVSLQPGHYLYADENGVIVADKPLDSKPLD